MYLDTLPFDLMKGLTQSEGVVDEASKQQPPDKVGLLCCHGWLPLIVFSSQEHTIASENTTPVYRLIDEEL